MSCTCGDLCCSSCGPAQGNYRCEVCGRWASEGCESPEECAALVVRLRFAERFHEDALPDLRYVVERLCARGHLAYYDYPGYASVIAKDGSSLAFGYANETLTGDNSEASDWCWDSGVRLTDLSGPDEVVALIESAISSLEKERSVAKRSLEEVE
jgi:hypothetical protein